MGRAAALLALLAALVTWYEVAPYLDPWRVWPSILVISFVLLPATFLMVWLLLPLWSWRWNLAAGTGLILLGLVLTQAGTHVGENFCKLFALTLVGWWFLGFFETVYWAVLIALLIPWVDAYSVWRGPTKQITEQHAHVFNALSVAFVVAGSGAARLGLPDILFFAVFLGTSARFGLRPFWTWLGMTIGLMLTMIFANWWDVSGLPALPAISLGFLVPNADLLWRRRRAQRATREGPDPSTVP